jgi:hypothetical protein
MSAAALLALPSSSIWGRAINGDGFLICQLWFEL